MRQAGADLFHSDGRTDTRTDMKELIFPLVLNIPVLLLNTKECCNQLTHHYIQEEHDYMFRLKIIFQHRTNYKNTKGGTFYDCISGFQISAFTG